jgi:cephalosporin-C deacetylase-like acetyl esterase
MGGAWNEPSYVFFDADAYSPFARNSNFGFRLARNLDDRTSPASLDPMVRSSRDYKNETPASEAVFRVFKGLYSYDKGPLNAAIESVDDTSELWRKEKIRFAAAYGGEHVVAYLFTPRSVPPPHQTVVFFPGTTAIRQRSSEVLAFLPQVVPVVKSGRAFLYPVYKSMYERGDDMTAPVQSGTALYRDHVVQWSKDLGRSIDYVETRKDLDSSRIAFYGVSLGGIVGPVLMAVEDRIRVGVLVAGGLRRTQTMPEADAMNFAPHLHRPVLMVNGRHDFIFPPETNQAPLFELLGSPAKDKRYVVLETAGHLPPNDLLTKEVLEWLDRYLGAPH